jgi:hypothetical protein
MRKEVGEIFGVNVGTMYYHVVELFLFEFGTNVLRIILFVTRCNARVFSYNSIILILFVCIIHTSHIVLTVYGFFASYIN